MKMSEYVSLKYTYLVFPLLFAYSFSRSALACMELPKSISLSGTTYQMDVVVSFSTNCYVQVNIETSAGTTFNFQRGGGENKKLLCATLTKNKDYANQNIYCGDQLIAESGKKNGEFTLLDNDGRQIGAIQVQPKAFQVLSWGDTGPTKSKPFLHFDVQDLNKNWQVKAMQNESTQVGGGLIETSGLCTRGGAKTSNQILDLRNQSFSTFGEGCTSGITVQDFGSGTP